MHAPARAGVDTNKLSAALGRFPPDRAMIIDGREVKDRGETIERSSPAHGVVTRVPRGTAEDARAGIAAARAAFDTGPWANETASNRARVLMKTGDLIDRDREVLTLLDSLKCGNPIAQARGETEGAATSGVTPRRWRASFLRPSLRMPPITRSRQASGVVTSILRSALDGACAPARSGLTLHGPSAGAALWRLPSVGGRPRTRAQRREGLYGRKDVSRPYGPANEPVAPAWRVIDGKNRELMQGFWIRSRTVFGGSNDLEGRQCNSAPY